MISRNRILAHLPNRTPQQIRQIAQTQVAWLDWLYFAGWCKRTERDHAVHRVINPLYRSEAE